MSEPASQSESAPAPSAWIRSRLTALFEDVRSQDAFDSTFSPMCEVRQNHAVRPLQTFKDEIASRRAAAVRASVAWPDAEDDVVVAAADPDSEEGGAATTGESPASTVVAGAFVVTRSLPFRIRVAHAQRRTHVCFSAKIEKDSSVQDGDKRRITSFYYTSVDRTPPIHFPVPRAAAQEGGST